MFPLFIPPILYAETHYRFKYFFSFLKKNEPEIIFDAPHRVEPNVKIPILLFIKDAHLHPIEIVNVSIIVSGINNYIKIIFIPINLKITEQFWNQIFYFTPDKSTPYGYLHFKCEVKIKIRNRQKIIKIDNYRFLKKEPLKIYRSAEKLSTNNKFIFGDLHYHSNFTNDQVEFGAPLNATQIIASSIGLKFFAVTDHSYDLDDEVFNFLKNDESLPKWKLIKSEVNTLNKNKNLSKIILGEEVSCRNENDKNVHLLVLGSDRFIRGSGDSAEKWFRTKSEFTIEEAINEADSNSVIIAAHPKEKIPFLHKLFFGRSNWSDFDLFNFSLNGMQILNGENSEAFIIGKQIWIKLLLDNQKIKIFAGNDAHGNFNNFRQLLIPFFKIVRKDFQIFGRMKTAIKTTNTNKLLSNIKNNFSVITTGPLMEINLKSKNTIEIIATSNLEFGFINKIILYIGDTLNKKEIVIYQSKFKKMLKFTNKIKLKNSIENSYVRGEVYTINGNGIFKNNFCFTNPIYLNEI